MRELTNKELLEINGGSKIGIAIIIGAIASFIVGIFDGIVRPNKC